MLHYISLWLTELFGLGYDKLIIEEFLTGEEVSVLALTDGKTIYNEKYVIDKMHVRRENTIW